MASNPPFLNLDYLFYQLYRLVLGVGDFDPSSLFTTFGFWFRLVSAVVSLALLTLVVHLWLKISSLSAEEKLKIFPLALPTVESTDANPRWTKVRAALNSPNPSDWKVAIIEADSMLDEMLQAMPLHGSDLGERLKAVDPADFLTLNDAWEAHKVRNRIAHDGNSYQLSEHEASRVIAMYEKVFREFDLI